MTILRPTAARFALAALLALALVAPALTAPVTRVLFIGNSYTYFNNLPEIVRVLAESAGGGRVEVRMVAPGGWRLADHWQKGEAHEALRSGTWDFVVLQEQSQLGDPRTVDGKPRVGSDKNFAPAAAQWAAEIERAGARPVFYSTWAKKASPEDQALLNDAYRKGRTRGRRDTGTGRHRVEHDSRGGPEHRVVRGRWLTPLFGRELLGGLHAGRRDVRQESRRADPEGERNEGEPGYRPAGTGPDYRARQPPAGRRAPTPGGGVGRVETAGTVVSRRHPPARPCKQIGVGLRLTRHAGRLFSATSSTPCADVCARARRSRSRRWPR